MTAEQLRVFTVSCRLQGKSVVEELRLVEHAHRLAYQDANSAFAEMRGEAIRKATAEIDATLVNEKAEVQALRAAYNQAERDVEDARIAETAKKGYQTDDDVLLPVGAKVQHRGKLGVIEVCTRQTVFADRIDKYSIPSVGSLFVRLCKKDGTPGKRVADTLYGWKLAGEDVRP